jgi:hypothetical protein
MKNFLSEFLFPFIAFLMIIGFASQVVHEKTMLGEIAAYAIVGTVMFISVLAAVFSQRNRNVTRMGVEVEIWAQYIIERLWKDNQFLKHAFSDDDKVLAGKIVHIPQPGAKPVTVKNRAVFPATAVRRTDTDILYPLDEYTTDPTHIQDAEKVELSYDKINSVYGDHAGQLVQDVADDAIVKWLLDIPQTSVIRTTGGATADKPDGATGNRKAFVHDNLRSAQKLMNKQNIPAQDRFALVTANMADQLFESLSNTQYRDFSSYADAKEGIIGRLYGFNIMHRSEIAISETTGGNAIIKPWGAAVDAADNEVSFCWHKNAIARALGEVKFFENPDRAEYYGDVYSALLRFGGRRRRADNFGIVAIIQDAA